MVNIAAVRPGKVGVIAGILGPFDQPRDVVSRFGKTLRCEETTIKDDSGQIKLTLWNGEVGKFHEGDEVKITDGWASEFRGAVQIAAGKYGRIERTQQKL